MHSVKHKNVNKSTLYTCSSFIHASPGLKVNHSAFCPLSALVFCMNPKKVVVFSLSSMKLLVFVTGSECAYCTVQTGYLNITEVNLSSSRSCKLQAFSRQSLTTETRVRS